MKANYHHLLLPSTPTERAFARLLWKHFRYNELHARLVFMRCERCRTFEARTLALCEELRCPPVVANAIYKLLDGKRHMSALKHLLHWCEKRSKRRDWFNGRRRP